MKTPLACAAALLLPLCATAQSSVTIYGVLDASATLADGGGGSVKRLDSGAGWGSRLGFRGSEDLGSGLRANFVMEQGLAADTGTLQQGGAAWGRQIWLSLSSQTWEVRMGRQLSPTALSLLAVDPFVGNYWGNLQATGIGSLQSAGSVPGEGGHQATARINNSVLGSLTTGPVLTRLLVAAGDENTTGSGRLVNGSVTYTQGPLLLTGAYSRFRQYARDIPAGAAPDWQTEWTLAAAYDFGPVRVNGGYYVYDPSERSRTLTAASLLKTESAFLGARAPLGPGQLLAQVIRTNTERVAGTGEGHSTMLSATYEYFLSKRSVAYLSYGRVSNNATSNTLLVGGTVAVVPVRTGADPRALSAGIRHSF